MLSSSKNEAKQESRFAARLDVLMERVDTLASTVATTASAMAKKDGEIAALQRAFEARDQTLQSLVQHVNQAAAPTADVPVDATELRSLRNAVAALTKERASGVNAAQIQSLLEALRTLDDRVGALAAAAATPPVPTTDPATAARIDAIAAELAAVRSVAEEQLDQRLEATRDSLAKQSERLDALAQTFEVLTRTQDDALERTSQRLDTLGTQSPRLEALADRFGELERMRLAEEEQLDRRLGANDDALANLTHGFEALAERLGSLESTRVIQDERIDHRIGQTSDALATLSQRLDAFPSVDEAQINRRFGETDDALATLARRLDALGETLGQLERTRAAQDEQLAHRWATTSDALATLSHRLDSLPSVDEAQLARLGETDQALATLTHRLDTLSASVESAAAGLGDKERELATLHRHFTDSSTRIESIVDDIRATLHALPDPSSTSLDELAARLERVETTTRKATESSARIGGELSGRIDVIDQRLATVAEEMSRAKTLWPVALRSLEARLDDAVHPHRPEPDGAAETQGADEQAEDLLAGLRHSIQAMETVAAEMARASETLGAADADDVPADEPETDDHLGVEPASVVRPDVEQPTAATGGGATIVPLRTGEP